MRPPPARSGFVKITEERGVSAGNRRLEAVSGSHALGWIQEVIDRQARVAGRLKAAPSELEDKLERMLERVSGLEKQLEAANQKLAASQGDDLASAAVEIGGAQIVVKRMDGADRKTLRETVDALKNKLDNAIVVLGAAEGDKVASDRWGIENAVERVPAGELVNYVARQVGGKGGGRPDMAQAGGSEPEKLDAALASVTGWIDERLSANAS